MEKAEILELTVNFLKMIREQQVTGLWVYNTEFSFNTVAGMTM